MLLLSYVLLAGKNGRDAAIDGKTLRAVEKRSNHRSLKSNRFDKVVSGEPDKQPPPPPSHGNYTYANIFTFIILLKRATNITSDGFLDRRYIRYYFLEGSPNCDK